jgi:hypothetical protein
MLVEVRMKCRDDRAVIALIFKRLCAGKWEVGLFKQTHSSACASLK